LLRTAGPDAGNVEAMNDASRSSIAGSVSPLRSSPVTVGPPQSCAAFTVSSPYVGNP